MKIISIEITESPLIIPNAGVIHTLSGKTIYRSVKLLEKEVLNCGDIIIPGKNVPLGIFAGIESA